MGFCEGPMLGNGSGSECHARFLPMGIRSEIDRNADQDNAATEPGLMVIVTDWQGLEFRALDSGWIKQSHPGIYCQ